MKFNEYQSTYSFLHNARLIDHAENALAFYARSMRSERDPMTLTFLSLEKAWYENKRPYYNIWPSILPCLLKTKLDLDASLIHPTHEAILLRLAENQLPFEVGGQKFFVRSILMGRSEVRRIVGDPSTLNKGMRTWIDFGERCEMNGFPNYPVYSFRSFALQSGKTVDECIVDLPLVSGYNYGVQVPHEIIQDCVRLCCAVCLLAEDHEIISPDVLTDDRAAFDRTQDQKFVQKALKKGKVGWDIGRHLELIPHYRRPHMALRWTGKGRTEPRISFVKGVIVHREIAEKIPTGYFDKQL